MQASFGLFVIAAFFFLLLFIGLVLSRLYKRTAREISLVKTGDNE